MSQTVHTARMLRDVLTVPIAEVLVAQGLARMQTTGKIFLVSHKFGPIPIII